MANCQNALIQKCKLSKCQNAKKSEALMFENDKNTKCNIKYPKTLEYIILFFFKIECHDGIVMGDYCQ